MLRLLRTHLALRSAALVLLIVGSVGLVFLSVATHITEKAERERQTARLNELLDTVESTASIAAFLGDRQLASELVRGLLKNRTVAGVTIRASASEAADDAAGLSTIQREVRSPFNPAETVGTISLLPNEAEIHSEVESASRFITLLLAVQLLCIGVGVVLVVVQLITRPILKISRRLHSLRAESGDKLTSPRGNEQDEIGRLVRDVNALIDYLINILDKERTLRIQREMDERQFQTIFENAETGIFLIDETGTLLSCNPAFKRIFGLSQYDSPERRQLQLAGLVGSSREDMQHLIDQCLDNGRANSQDIALPDAGGNSRTWINVVLSAVENSRLQGVVNDITERKLVEETATELATTDPLTGLLNRRGFELRLEAMIQLCRRDASHGFALLMLDLDLFKAINDTYGHQAGDAALVHIATILTRSLRKTDVIARLGGDEFVVLLDGMQAPQSIALTVEKLLAQMDAPIPLGGGIEAQLGLSIGVAVFARDASDISSLLEAADQAMYAAKQAGRNTYRFHTPPPGE